MSRPWVLLCVALWGMESAALGADLHGVIKLESSFKPVPAFDAPGYWHLPNDVLEIQPPLVDPRSEMLVELVGSGLPARPPAKAQVRIEDFRFIPTVIAVKPGAKLTVTNLDSALHIVETAESKEMPAHRVGSKTSVDYAFTKPGAHRIRCSEYPHVTATVYVSDAPLVTIPDATGTYAFPEFPGGTYTLRIWYAGKAIYTQPVAARGKTRLDVQLKSAAGKD